MAVSTKKITQQDIEAVRSGLVRAGITLVVGLIIMGLLVSYIYDIMRDPRCSKIDPFKRRFLYIYGWIELVFGAIGLILVVMLYFTIRGLKA